MEYAKLFFKDMKTIIIQPGIIYDVVNGMQEFGKIEFKMEAYNWKRYSWIDYDYGEFETYKKQDKQDILENNRDYSYDIATRRYHKWKKNKKA